MHSVVDFHGLSDDHVARVLGWPMTRTITLRNLFELLYLEGGAYQLGMALGELLSQYYVGGVWDEDGCKIERREKHGTRVSGLQAWLD